MKSLPPLHCVKFAEVGPPRRSVLHNGTPVWLVTRYEDVRAVLTDTPNLLNEPNAVFNQDDAQHQRLRGALQKTFTPSGIRRMRPWLSSVVDRTHLLAVVQRHARQRAALAQPFEQLALLGIHVTGPARADPEEGRVELVETVDVSAPACRSRRRRASRSRTGHRVSADAVPASTRFRQKAR
jgi:hypothetical protein